MKKIFNIVLILAFVICPSFLLVSCSKGAEAKTFSSGGFTITATVDYIKETQYGDNVLVLEGKDCESIVAYYDYGNSTMDPDATTLSSFTQNVKGLSYFYEDSSEINEIVINKKDGYTETTAQYFISGTMGKGYGNSAETPEREKFNINYTNINSDGAYNYLVITAKVDNAFAVVHIGGKQDTFNQKKSEYLSYAKSLLISNVSDKDATFEQVLSATTKQTSAELFSDVAGFNMQIPSDFIYYDLGVNYSVQVGNLVIKKNDTIYGSISLTSYSDNWDSISDYSIIWADLSKLEAGYDINQYMVYVGQNRYLGIYYKSISISEDWDLGPGAVTETLYFQFKVGSRTYILNVEFSAEFESTPSGTDQYLWSSYNETEMTKYMNSIEQQVFSWIQTIELI